MPLFDNKVKIENGINNLIHLFNSWVRQYKSMPNVMLLGKIRMKLMARVHDKFA